MPTFHEVCEAVCDCLQTADHLIRMANQSHVDDDPSQAAEAVDGLGRLLRKVDHSVQAVCLELKGLDRAPTDGDDSGLRRCYHELGFSLARRVYVEVFRAAGQAHIMNVPLAETGVFDPVCIQENWSSVKTYLEEEAPTFSAKTMTGLVRQESADAERRYGSKTLRPQWDRQGGELRFAGQRARQVSDEEEDVAKILDVLQAERWPQGVAVALLQDESLHEAVRLLNRGLVGLRFHVNQNMVTWEETHRE